MVRIDKDEIYPYYFINDTYGPEVELSADELALAEDAEALFNKAQNMLAAKAESA